jgi:uncharacterized phage protein (TIGR01671 family)
MREILFRGKRCDNGEWVNGFLLKECNYATCSWNLAIEYKTDRFGKFAYDVAEVVTETVSQFTGLTDKNGKKIFEGDILKWDVAEWGGEHCELVEWDYSLFSMRKNDWQHFCEVIGNIHDNPELLENP